MTRRILPLVSALLFASSCTSANDASNIKTTGQFRAEVWADNWFSFSLGETFIHEDSVSINTERSFNKEVFGFDGTYPLVLNFTVKDYKANDTGLEYIGTDKQQMGDGGFIVQIKDTTTGKYVAVSNASWKCLVIHRAPTNVSCEKDANPAQTCQSEILSEPSNWKTAGFDTSSWPSAVEYSESDVSPKDGYDEVAWDSSAKLIWSSSLKPDNTLLCRLIVSG